MRKINTTTKKELERRVFELRAQLASSEHFFINKLKKCGTDRLIGSAVILSIDLLGKDERTTVAIMDGLSPETINAISKDLQRSYETKIIYKPTI